MKAKTKIISVLVILALLMGSLNVYSKQSDKQSDKQPEQSTQISKTQNSPNVGIIKNNRFSLEVDPKEGSLILTDTQGKAWSSPPKDFDNDKIAQNVTKLAMQSLVQIEYSDKLSNIKTLNAKTASVNKGGLSFVINGDSIRLEFLFSNEGFKIPLQISLNADFVEMSILTSDIEEQNKDYKITTISLLPYFGATGSNEQGYLFVPDGCGVIIDYNNTVFADDYQQRIYGQDPSITKYELDEISQTVMMPVFGLKSNQNAFLGIVSQGAARAEINASIKGKRSDFSNIYAKFIYRESEMTFIEQKNQTIRIFESNPPT